MGYCAACGESETTGHVNVCEVLRERREAAEVEDRAKDRAFEARRHLIRQSGEEYGSAAFRKALAWSTGQRW